MRVTIFGGSSPRPGDPAYMQAYRLGSMLAAAGHTVQTGAYSGTMEAISKGACEAGGHVVGMTCDEIENWRPVPKNSWVLEEIRFPSLHERLLGLIDAAEAAIALPGGAGTLAEISLFWNRLIVHSMQERPLILVGTAWKQVFTKLFETQGEYVPVPDRGILHFVETVEDAYEAVQEHQNQMAAPDTNEAR